jgi:multidrug resistance efflux pump
MIADPAILEAAARALEDEINAFVSPKEVSRIAAASVLAAVTPLIRAAALEEAAKECDRHAEFCKSEAHKGGDFQHLTTRYDEAKYNAQRIRALIDPSGTDIPPGTS